MLKAKMKRFLALVLTGTMLCGSMQVSASSGTDFDTYAEETTEFAVGFDNAYAEVGTALTVTAEGAANVTYQWYVGGKAVSGNTTNSYTPTENDLEKWIEVQVNNGTETLSAKMYCSKLPVVYVNTENGQAITSKENYIDATIKIQGNAQYKSTGIDTEVETEIRGRGNSTWGQPKKPYKLKLGKKADVMGMGKNKHWVLLANYLDESLMRNTLCYNLAGSLEMDQMSTVWVDLVMNGEYVGNYQLCENVRIDDTRVDILDWEGFAEDSADVIAEAENLAKADKKALETVMSENMGWITSKTVSYNGQTYDITQYPNIKFKEAEDGNYYNGGYLLELDEYWDEVSKFKTASGQPLQFKSPEFINTNSEMMNFVKDYIQAFEDAVQSADYTVEYQGESTHYSDLYDFKGLVDYWLVTEIFYNEEMNKKSTYMYKDLDGKMIMGPIWDMDWSSGAGGTSAGATNRWATLAFNTNAQRYQWYKYLVQDPYFLVKVQEKYWQIRNLQVQDMLDAIDESYELIKESGKADSALWHSQNTFDNDFNGLKTWLNTHIAWMDQQMDTEDSLDSSFMKKDQGLVLTLTDTEGNALMEDYAEQAPADAFIGKSADSVLHISGKTDGTAKIYINSKLAGTVELNGQGAEYTIAASALTETLETKNVIEVKVTDNTGSVTASNYITIRQSICDHSFGEGWEKNDAQHWKQCANCDLQLGLADHTLVWVIDKEATAEENGTRHQECSVCGYAHASESYEYVELPESPSDSSKDLPVSAMTAIAASEYPGKGNEGPAALVLDGNENTHWHTNYGAVAEGEQLANRWIGVTLEEPTKICGIRCLPRSGGGNGTVTEYEVQYRTTDNEEENWITVASGTWDRNDTSWKLVSFTPVVAKQVRIVGIHTYYSNTQSDHGDRHMSMAEFRVIGRTVEEEKKVDKSALEALILEAQGYDSKDYTEESWAAADLETEIAKAEAVLEDGTVSQTVVDEAVTALKAAIKILVIKIPENVIPVSEMTATAGDAQIGEGPELTLDENENTIWHTNWSVGENHENHWLQLELKEVYEITSFRYLPRQNGENGIITEYEIYVSLDGETWEQAAKGTWDKDHLWKVTVFAEAKEAKYVRLVTINAASNQSIKFASAAEVRLTGEKVETPVQVDKTALNEAIAKARTLNASDYTEESWTAANLETVIAAAVKVAEDENASETDVKEALSALETAMGMLEKAPDPVIEAKAELKVVIDYASELNPEDYEDFTEAEQALEEARNVYADEKATLEDVSEAYDRLVTAIENLEEKTETPVEVDKTALNEAIAKARTLNASDYTEESWTAADLETVIASAVKVAEDENASEAEVKEAVDALETAMGMLEKAPDPVIEAKAELKVVIDYASELNPEDYEDFTEAEQALEEAKTVYADEKATLEDVSEAYDRLVTAIENLEEKTETPEEPAEEKVIRLSGTDRYQTGMAVAEELKAVLGVEKFETAIIATGSNFADALSGSYLAAVKDAPILLTNGKAANVAALHEYIKENVTAGGTIYVLGGEGAVSAAAADIEGYNVERLSGADRYETNLAILAEAGYEGDDLIVATGKSFADSLSASAAGKPILLAKKDAALNDAQKAVAANFKNIYVVGGAGAVAESTAAELAAYGNVTRLSGASRYETSVAIANAFFADADQVVLASGKNFPDGLCGGALAAALNAPLVLTRDGSEAVAADYVAANEIASGYVLGGEGALSNEIVVTVFGLESADDIVKTEDVK